MHSRQALFLVSALLFISSVSFVVLSARSSRSRAAATEAAPLTLVASVRQIMRGIVDPAATKVFGAVSTTITAAGTEEEAPDTVEEWDAVANSRGAGGGRESAAARQSGRRPGRLDSLVTRAA